MMATTAMGMTSSEAETVATTSAIHADDSEVRGLQGLGLEIGYDSGDQALREFYVPALSRAVAYDRSVGFFRASAISAAARGVSRFVARGGRMRLLIGAQLNETDLPALVGATEIPESLAARLAYELVAPDEIAARRFEVLAWLVREGRLEVKVAVPIDPTGAPMPPDMARPYFHEKIGILRDAAGDGVAFQGSVNESDTAWTHNFESFSVYKSWDGSAPYFDEWQAKFEQRWAGDVPAFRVFDLPDPAVRALLTLAPDRPPPARDPEEGPESVPHDLLATFLAVAPRLAGGGNVAEATSGVRLFPHQSKVVARLAGEYPRSWLVADEVGLGKTISAGLALRQLLLTGQANRVLILAPAGVCRQWQDELFEKFGLWVPRLDRGRIHGAHPDDVRPVADGENPYASERILLVSSHLARRQEHQGLILAAPPLDLLIVDEAQHARRQGADIDRYRPSRLLALLDAVDTSGHARATWLLTATPMQIDPVELVDLLRQVGLSGRLADPIQFERYYAELAKPRGSRVDWRFLARTVAGADVGMDEADLAVLARIEAELGPVGAERIRRFGQFGEPVGETVETFSQDGLRELRTWLQQRGPIGRLVTRHTRQILRRYRASGLLDERIADRDVKAIPIVFSRAEQRLYDGLDAILDRLMQAYGSRRHAGFVLTVYRRRLTSSWAAIAATLRRRLEGEYLRLEEDTLDEVDVAGIEGEESDEGTFVDDKQAVPLSEQDLAELTAYLRQLEVVGDSKFEQLRTDLDKARGSGQAVIVFTGFTDTLDHLRDRLHPAYRSHLATYTGDGGRMWTDEGGWQNVAKADLIEALRSGRVSVILATDAASEGLNLQVASYLINFDLPWNPMRVEQRIGRIDRIGQARPIVTVRNYVIPDTVEEAVYGALARRIDIFSGLLGRLQPILGATEAAFEGIFRAPRSERKHARDHAISELMAKVDSLERSGIDLDPEDDPMPDAPSSAPAVDLGQLRVAVVEDIGEALDQPGRPASFRPDRVSRDPERWCAFATYGHPRLPAVLERHAGYLGPGVRGAVAFGEVDGVWAAYRADRTPPAQVCTLTDLADPGEPASAGDATERASRAARRLAEARAERARAALRQSRERWLAALRAQFTALVREAVSATSVLHARAGDGVVEPRLVWLDLRSDRNTAWRNADSLRQHLGLDLATLLPGRPATEDARSDSELEAVRGDTGRRLNELVKQWTEGVRSS
jgi:superfamily II DNA or RNA helicase